MHIYIYIYIYTYVYHFFFIYLLFIYTCSVIEALRSTFTLGTVDETGDFDDVGDFGVDFACDFAAATVDVTAIALLDEAPG